MNQTWNDVIRELYDSAYKQGAIDILQKIKAEMNNEGWYNTYDKRQFAKIMDKHISELSRIYDYERSI